MNEEINKQMISDYVYLAFKWRENIIDHKFCSNQEDRRARTKKNVSLI